MDSIWKINSKYLSDADFDNYKFLSNIYLCTHCCIRTNSIKFRKMLKKDPNPQYQIVNKYESCLDVYAKPFRYTSCYICKRYIQGIQTGPDIVKFLDSSIQAEPAECESSIYLQLAKISTWYFHDIYDDFGHYLRKRYNFSHGQVKNIYQSIDELYGLPSIEIINQRADYLNQMVRQHIVGNTIN